MNRHATALLATLFLLPLAVVTAQAEIMKPGQWEITSENQMAGMGGQGMSVTVRHCVTKEQAEKGVPPQPKNDQHCEQKSVKREGNKVSWSMECSGEHPVSGTGSVVFDSPEHYQGNSTIDMKDPKHPMTMKQRYSGKWLSATCEK